MTKEEVMRLVSIGESRVFYMQGTANRTKEAIIGLLVTEFKDDRISGTCESHNLNPEYAGIAGTLLYKDMRWVV